MEIVGHNRSSSLSSLSSFDSCSDLLGLFDKSSHGSAQTQERQQEGETLIGRIPTIDGNVCLAGAKNVNASQNGSGSSVLLQDGGLNKVLIKQEGSLQARKDVNASQNGSCEGEEIMINAEAHGLENLATELSAPTIANKHKPLEDRALKKGAQRPSPTCSRPANYKLSSSSLLLSNKDTLSQDAGSYPAEIVSGMPKGLDYSQQRHISRSEGDDDACDNKKHNHPVQFAALDPMASSATDIAGVKRRKDEVVSSECVHQVHNHISKSGSRLSSEADYDLQQLENSIKFFDLYQKSTSLSHPLPSMSSQCSSPDLNMFERIDSAEAVHRKQSYGRSLSPRRDRKFASVSHKKLRSAGMLPWLNYEESTKARSRHKGGKEAKAHQMKLIVVDSENLGGKTGSNGSLPEWKEAPLAQALEDKEENGQSMIDGELHGNTQVKSSWKISSLERKPVNVDTSDSNGLGPDELFRYLESLDVNETYMDTIMDIKNPLLANCSNRGTCHPCDGTSGLHMPHSHCILSAKDIPFVVDSVQVFGARQRRGGSSLWERMVGVKDHTVYCIKVVSGKHEWEVLRRYRDFMNFYQQLKRIFNGRSGTTLLSPSEEIEKESRKVFGSNSPSVVEARTFRIEKFLQSLLQAGPPFSTAAPVFWFLRPSQGAFETTCFEEHLMVQASTLQKSLDVQLGTLDAPHLQSPSSSAESSKREQNEDRLSFTINKTIKLVLTIHQNKSFTQVLHAQHYSCAGCYRHLEYEKGLIPGFAQALGRGKPRFCEYTGHLFCSSCHLNEFAVLPAHVLWNWDFTPRRASQLAKSYLDSIYDQPLLCVRTANPYLYQRVPCLHTVKETRTKLSRVLSCMRCPSRARILQVMGSRRYLLENNDFFALRDLEDLSKGAFAVLPGLLAAVLKTLMLHVTKQCSVCQDTGEWCGAGILCEDPFHPIFPFNEEENIMNCKMCNAPFHQTCFAKCSSCPSCPKDWVDNKQKKARGED